MSKITGKIIFQGTLINFSPIIIGTGKGKDTNIEVIRGYNGNFYIPASSFIGALRHYIDENYKLNGEFYIYFWGDGNYQSNFILEDILPGKACKIVVRDGVKIDNKKGIAMAEEGAKFNYEVVEGEINLNLFGEAVFREEFDKCNEFLRIFATIKRDLENGEISVGAMTTKGFGRLKLNNFEAFYFKFPGDGEKYLRFLASGKENVSELKVNFQDLEPFSKDNQDFIVEAAFSLENSLIIGSNAPGPEEVDKGHLKSNGKPILSGTSIKGAIRDRAVKIINTLKKDDSGEDFIKETFGWVDNKAKSKEKYKSRVIVDESFIDESVIEETQARTKIDRFTGGTISVALFKSKPIWHKDEKIKIKIKVKNYEPWEAGLILLVLKDLWNGDLPIGGEKAIGRGLLNGIKADIISKEGNFKIIQERENIKIEGDKSKLDSYLKEFINKIGIGGKV